MEWNVYHYNINKSRIETFNIFCHSGFREDVQDHAKKHEDKEAFAKAVKTSLMYYFWARSEYEILIRAWCGGNGDEEVKIDIYSQVMMNWDKFIDYLWNERNKDKYIRPLIKEK